jgi:ActR/RegA family two-component response regulator
MPIRKPRKLKSRELQQEFLRLTRLATLGYMSAGIAHEVNNPLMAVQGMAENMELMLDNPQLPREEMRLHLLQMIKACQRISQTVAKMNRMSRHQKIRLFVVDLAEVALNALDLVKAQLGDLGVKLHFDFERPLPIKCDSVQVEQIIFNILRNALSALETGRNEDRQIRISFAQQSDGHLIKIWNNGPPIPKTAQTKIMDPFFTTKPEDEGTGLGLAISKSIMRLHGGSLSFKSNVLFGTEFCLSFPRPKVNPWARRARQSLGTIVIIDPQTNYRRTLEEKFLALGFKVKSCADFDSGWALLSGEPLAGCMIDIIPGQAQSLDFVQRVRAQLGPQPLIFTVSNYPSARDWRGELRERGADDSFEKPLHAENFNRLLKLLDNSQHAQRKIA